MDKVALSYAHSFGGDFLLPCIGDVFPLIFCGFEDVDGGFQFPHGDEVSGEPPCDCGVTVELALDFG